MDEYCKEYEKHKDIMIIKLSPMSKERKIKDKINKIKENAEKLLDIIFKLKKNKNMIKNILNINKLIITTDSEDINDQLKINEKLIDSNIFPYDFFNLFFPNDSTQIVDKSQDIFKKILDIDASIDDKIFDIDNYKILLDNICYGLYGFLKSRKENEDFNTNMSETILNKIKKIYDNNDIVYLCIAPGHPPRIPKYLEKVMESKKVGIIYIQNSENSHREIYGTNKINSFIPFWKNENFTINYFKNLNDKIRDNLEVLIITYYFDSEYILKKVNKLINKKTLFYLGFIRSGFIDYKSYKETENFNAAKIFGMFCLNNNVVLVGPNGYNLPNQELVEIDNTTSDSALRNQNDTLTFDDETNKKIQEFLLVEPIIPVVEVHEEHKEGGFYNKYIKYKEKYLQLKLNKNLQ
jgi:hypothetical protein